MKKILFIGIITLTSCVLAYYLGKALAAYEKGKSMMDVFSAREIAPLLLALGVSFLGVLGMKGKAADIKPQDSR